MNSLGKPLPVHERESLPGFSGKFEIIGDDRSPYDPSMPVARVQERGCSRFLYEISILWFADDSMGRDGLPRLDAEALLSFAPEVKTHLRLVRRPPTK